MEQKDLAQPLEVNFEVLEDEEPDREKLGAFAQVLLRDYFKRTVKNRRQLAQLAGWSEEEREMFEAEMRPIVVHGATPMCTTGGF